MSAAPISPKEERSFADNGEEGVEDGAMTDRADGETDVRTGQSDDAELDPGEQGEFGNLGQTLTTRWQVRDR